MFSGLIVDGISTIITIQYINFMIANFVTLWISNLCAVYDYALYVMTAIFVDTVGGTDRARLMLSS